VGEYDVFELHLQLLNLNILLPLPFGVVPFTEFPLLQVVRWQIGFV
jgi:hypothetical protein